jgi:hypothetical protein
VVPVVGSPLRVRADVDIDGNVRIAGEDPYEWATGAWSGLTMVPITLATNTFTASTPASGSFNLQRGRLAWAAGAEGSDRRAYLFPEYSRDGRIRGTWQDHSVKSVGSPGIQAGYVLGAKLDPDGYYRAIVIRHDIVFGQDQIIQVGWWRWRGVNDMTIDANDVGTFPGLSGLTKTINVANAVRAGNVVTASGIVDATTGFATTLVAGHTYTASFPSDTSYNVTFVATNATQWPQVAADDPGSGAGTVTDLDGVWPLNVDAVKDGPACYVKAWRDLTPEPSWSNAAYNVVMRGPAWTDPYIDNPGRKGLFIGHGITNQYAEWGPLDRRQ